MSSTNNPGTVRAEIRLIAEHFARIARLIEGGKPITVGVECAGFDSFSDILLTHETLKVRWAGERIVALRIERGEERPLFWPSADVWGVVPSPSTVYLSIRTFLVPVEVM